MNGEEFAAAVASIQTGIAGIVSTVVAPAGKVFNRYAMEGDAGAWAGLLRSGGDVDAAGAERVHAWLIGFGGISHPNAPPIRSIEPELTFTVDAFWGYELGIDTDNSERRARNELMKVVWAVASVTHLNAPEFVSGHRNLRSRFQLGTLGSQVVHQSFGELSVVLQPQVIR